MSKERVLIIDGLNLFLRNYAVNPTTDTNGEHIGGMFGSLRSVKNLIRDVRPTRVVVCWDGKGGSQKRRGIYAEYKAGRKPRVNRAFDFGEDIDASKANLQMQYSKIRKYLEMLGICQIEMDNCEADDVICVLCRFVYDGIQKVIVSTDRDFYQLIDNRTLVFSPTKKLYYGPGEIREELGVLACNYIFVKAICGDGSDNIKGATQTVGTKGLGPKTVVKFFPFLGEKESSLEEIRLEAEKLVPKGKREKELLKALLEQWDIVKQNAELMQLSVPIISPQAVSSIRYQVCRDVAEVNVSATKLALIKDCIQLSDQDFFTVFQEYARRHAR
jgi:5'-3' exonuclease